MSEKTKTTPFSPFIIALLAWVVAAALPASAQPQFQFRGYAKNLGIRATSFFTSEAYLLDVSRLRTRGLFDAGTRLHAEVYLDTELLVGDFLETTDYELGRDLERTTLFDLGWNVAEGRRYLLRQRLFRAFATYYAGRTQLTVGRQRIAWGTGFAWNPTDLLNPFNPAAIELDEKEGVDAAYLLLPFATLSRVEAVVAPGHRRGQTSAALRVGTHVGEYDISLMAGSFREDWVVGGDFAGYVGNAGLRGEAAYTFTDEGRNYLRAVVNADYNFAGGYYVFLELYFNGQGTRDQDDYDFTALISGRSFNVARDYGAASVSKLITPLLAFSLYSLVNLDDRSSLVGPSLSYSLLQNLEVSGATYLFFGADDTEFGAQDHIVFASLQFYF